MKKLFEPYEMNGISLKNRFVMAPMTRSRSSHPGNIPNAMMAKYYGQRASVGLIVTEATQISLQGMGYAGTPGIYSAEQVEGWKKVTEEVHSNGGKIFLQLWHVGRVSSSRVNGLQPLGPSDLSAKDTNVYIFDGAPNDSVTFIPVDSSKAMTEEDIKTTIHDFANGAKNAVKAGFDGVEIHGANGYLIDQFLRANSNKRTDKYGGSKENRTRIVEEIATAVSNAIGRERTGIRLSPFIKFKNMEDPEIFDTIMIASEKIEKIGLTYIHLCEADWDDAPKIPITFREKLRKIYSGTIIVTGNKTPEEGEELLQKNLVDAIGFGRKILANPDYVERVKQNAQLNTIEKPYTLYGGRSEIGYTDYAFLQ